MKKGYNCPYCKKEIIKDIMSYIEKYSEEIWMQCPYCRKHIKMSKIQEEIK